MLADTKAFSAFAVDDLAGAFIAAWFKDPAGNVREVLQER